MAKRYRLPKDVVARITKTVQAAEAYCTRHPRKKLSIRFARNFPRTPANIALRDEIQGYLESIPNRFKALLIKRGVDFVMKDKGADHLAMYNPFTNKVLLSPLLLQISPEERKVTLVHEIGHILDNILGAAVTAPHELHKKTNQRRRQYAAKYMSESAPVSITKNSEWVLFENILQQKLFSNKPFYMDSYLNDLETREANKVPTELEDFYDQYVNPVFNRKKHGLIPRNAVKVGAAERFAVSLERLLVGSNQDRKLEEKWKHTGAVMLCVLAALAGEEKVAVKPVVKPVAKPEARRPAIRVAEQEQRLAA